MYVVYTVFHKKKLLNFVTDSQESKQSKLAVYLNKALCHQKLNEHDEAKDAVSLGCFFYG